jgi:hypothetical protein
MGRFRRIFPFPTHPPSSPLLLYTHTSPLRHDGFEPAVALPHCFDVIQQFYPRQGKGQGKGRRRRRKGGALRLWSFAALDDFLAGGDPVVSALLFQARTRARIPGDAWAALLRCVKAGREMEEQRWAYEGGSDSEEEDEEDEDGGEGEDEDGEEGEEESSGGGKQPASVFRGGLISWTGWDWEHRPDAPCTSANHIPHINTHGRYFAKRQQVEGGVHVPRAQALPGHLRHGGGGGQGVRRGGQAAVPQSDPQFSARRLPQPQPPQGRGTAAFRAPPRPPPHSFVLRCRRCRCRRFERRGRGRGGGGGGGVGGGRWCWQRHWGRHWRPGVRAASAVSRAPRAHLCH